MIVWCVTGVCEAAGELSDSAHTGKDKNQLSSEHQEAAAGSCVPANHSPSPPGPANEKPSPVPISRQPAPGVRHLSASRWRPAASAAPPTTETPAVSTNHRRGTVADQAPNPGGGTSCPVTNEKTGAAAAHLSKRSSRNLPPSTPAADRTSNARAVRVLTQSEHQSMRRVLPIRTGPRRPDQKQPRSSGTEDRRSSTAPSPRSAVTKSLEEPRSSEEQQGPRQDSQHTAPTGRTGVRPRVQAEEKLCRSALRALGGGAGGGGGASTSAPTTPAHKAPPATPRPSFTWSTAASSFRRSSPAPPTSSSVASSSSSSLTRAGSLRVSRSSDLQRPACPANQDPAAAGRRSSSRSSRSSRPVWR